ncbi:hypothetical protein ES703_51473 [subsurface metagenome]
MSSLSISFVNNSILTCSVLIFLIVPTITTGFSPFFLWKFESQGRDTISFIISSATSLASVSFHLPERSVTSVVDILFTVLPPAQPQRIRRKARIKSMIYFIYPPYF